MMNIKEESIHESKLRSRKDSVLSGGALHTGVLSGYNSSMQPDDRSMNSSAAHRDESKLVTSMGQPMSGEHSGKNSERQNSQRVAQMQQQDNDTQENLLPRPPKRQSMELLPRPPTEEVPTTTVSESNQILDDLDLDFD